jgi:hypothetical protein
MRFWLTVTAVVTVLAVLAMGCGDDDDDDTGDGGVQGSAEDVATVEQLVRDLLGGDSTDQADVDFFFAHVTDNLLEGFFETTREDCMANAVDCIGEPSEEISVENTKVSGDDASTDATLDFGNFTFVMVRDGGDWKVDALKAISPDIPADVTAVTLQLNEFAFGFNRSDIEDGNFAFASENIGKQIHQVVVWKLDKGVVLDEAVQYEGDDLAPGVTEVASAAPILPGDQVNVVFEEPLDAGRYALICFFPDTEGPEQSPHAFKGMQAEFEVPAE